MKTKYCILLLSLFVLTYCSTSSKSAKTNKEILLTEHYRKIDNTNLFIKIPNGWHEINDNHKKQFDLWLVSPDGNSSIVFIPLHADKNFSDEKRALQFLTDRLKNIKQKSTPFYVLKETGIYENNNIKLAGFVYKENGSKKQSVIFGKGNTFYECLAFYKSGYEASEDDFAELFKTQELVLSTLKIE